MHIETYPDREALNMGVADHMASALRTALAGSDTVSLAVPGGTTPGPIFDTLSALKLDWARVRVMLTDERWVPPDHPRSNTGLLRQRLLTGHASAATLMQLYADGAPEDVLPDLSRAIAPHVPLSLVLLGMGADMHTASLFPGAPGLTAALAPDAPELCLLDPADQPDRRVSLSARVLNSAIEKHLVIIGADKRKALDASMALPPEQAPIQAVASDICVHWTEEG